MDASAVHIIPLWRLAVVLLPVAAVIALLARWSLDARGGAVAVLRMFVQLLAVGFVLVFIFEAKSAWIVLAVLVVMVTLSAWIGLRTVPERRAELYLRSLVSVFLGGGAVLVLVTQGVLALDPWYTPRYTVPLAGMIFSAAMTSVSLAAERFHAEIERGTARSDAQRIALTTSLIPITNNMLAVGLVSLPGMMTGQILSGVDPLMAVRYQIVVMCMVYGASGLAAAVFLVQLQDIGRSALRTSG